MVTKLRTEQLSINHLALIFTVDYTLLTPISYCYAASCSDDAFVSACFTDRYGGPGVELSGQHDDSAAVFQIFMFDQVFNTVR